MKKMSLRQYAALGIAGVGDLIDFGLGAVPGIGEPLDVGIGIINSFLLKDPRPMIGLVELAPVVVIDFLPIHTLLAWWTIQSPSKSLLKAVR
ncbi:MAG: hypothetical protein MN733_28895 [Nitrososphaera sp.]|nr:hypothetical protein [Nitrososphaera sp.]